MSIVALALFFLVESPRSNPTETILARHRETRLDTKTSRDRGDSGHREPMVVLAPTSWRLSVGSRLAGDTPGRGGYAPELGGPRSGRGWHSRRRNLAPSGPRFVLRC